ncbi:MAG: ABC transporter substrate-binding protein [Actinomycetota bacterium]
MIRARRTARTTTWARFLTAGLALMLGLAACGGGDDDDGPATGEGTENGDGDEGDQPDAEGEPVAGGELIYGIEAETDGLNPTVNRFAIAGVEMGRAVFDALTAFDEDGVAQPYLAESLTPNEDFTVWTITLRPGITFHDGTPLTSEAIKAHFEGILADPLTSLVPKWIFEGTNPVAIVDELTATVTMSGSVATFPQWLTAQFGMIASPTWLAAAKADPTLNQSPVGTGPFKIESRELNTQTTFVRNDAYWQDGLPHLDSVKFVVAVDHQVRAQNLTAGDFNIIHTTRGEDIASFQDDDSVRLYTDEVNEETFLMMNMDEPPMDDLRVRTALAQSTNREEYVELNNGGIGTVANSIFHPDHIFSTGVENFPEYDPDAAAGLIEEYCAEVPDQCDGGKVKFEYKTTPNPDNDLAFQTFSDQWGDIVSMTKVPVEQASFITEAAIGNYQMVLWRQFGALDPDYDATFIDQRSLGAISINWPRLDNDEIQALMLQQRAEPDLEARREAWGEINTLINDVVPYIWLNHTVWAITTTPEVHGVEAATLPDGSKAYPIAEGRHFLQQIWVEP